MYKDKAKQKQANRGANRRYRERKGITEGITPSVGITEGITPQDSTKVYPDILDKLTNPVWRGRLEKICHTFQTSHHPSYACDVTLGVYGVDLGIACDWLEITSQN